jgi:hypothetical protein
VGWGNSLFPLLIVTSSGGFTGFFVYSPGPGTGKLILSIAGSAGTDPFGNAYPAGLASYNSHSKVINLLSTAKNAFFQYLDSGAAQGQLILAVSSASSTDPVTGSSYNAGLFGEDVFGSTMTTVGPLIHLATINTTGPAAIGIQDETISSLGPDLFVTTPLQNTGGGNGQLFMFLFSDRHDGSSKAAAYLWRDTATGNVLATTLGICGNIFPTLSGTATPGTLETWHSIPLAAGWTQNAAHTPARYRLLASPANCIQIEGDVLHASFSGTSAISTALPAAYIPSVNKESDFQVATAGQAPHILLDTSGIISMSSAGAGTTRVNFNEIFSLD